MSDEHFKGRHPPGDARPRPADADNDRVVPKRTILGLPGLNPDGTPIGARPGLSGRTPEQAAHGAQHALPPSSRGAESEENLYDSVPDRTYMDPPSETFARAQTQRALDPVRDSAAPPIAAFSPQPPAAFSVPPPAAFSLPPASPRAATNPSTGAGTGTSDPAGRAARSGSAQAPEAWRNAVRNMANSARPAPPERGSSAVTSTPGLRLKLDPDSEDDRHPNGVPKSRLPGVLMWLLLLAAVGGGGAYWVDGQGGVDAVVARFRGGPAQPEQVPGAEPSGALTPTGAVPPNALTGAAPAGATPLSAATTQSAAPPSAAGAQPATPPLAANTQPGVAATTPSGQVNAVPGAAAAIPSAEADQAARALADPEPPSEATTKPTSTEPTGKAGSADKLDRPAATATAAKPTKAPPHRAPERPITRHEPVVQIRDLNSQSARRGAPPEPPDMPYVPPVPADPPSPDEPR